MRIILAALFALSVIGSATAGPGDGTSKGSGCGHKTEQQTS